MPPTPQTSPWAFRIVYNPLKTLICSLHFSFPRLISPMEFWGVEVKAGEPLKVEPGEDKILHLSQASLGEVKKDKANDSIPLYVKIGGQKIVIGTLSPEKCTHISYDLVFEKEFELSHNFKNGSVYFCGYTSVLSDDADDFSDFDSDSGEDFPIDIKENGKSEPKEKQAKAAIEKANASKPDSSAAKPKVKIVEPKKEVKPKEEDQDDESDEEDDDESDDEDMLDIGDESDDDISEEDGSSDEDDEATPKKAEPSKKRPAGSVTKTPTPAKKAKSDTTPQKTDGKKVGAHTATPHPSKKGGKTPATDKSKPETPKSAGQVSCNTCSKTFKSDGALQSHSKAKHSDGK